MPEPTRTKMFQRRLFCHSIRILVLLFVVALIWKVWMTTVSSGGVTYVPGTDGLDKVILFD